MLFSKVIFQDECSPTHLLTKPSGFDWASLPEGSVIVDVGGGIGVSSISIARAFDHLKCIVQDRAMVLKLGTEVYPTLHIVCLEAEQ